MANDPSLSPWDAQIAGAFWLSWDQVQLRSLKEERPDVATRVVIRGRLAPSMTPSRLRGKRGPSAVPKSASGLTSATQAQRERVTARGTPGGPFLCRRARC